MSDKDQLRQKLSQDKSHHQGNGKFRNPWPSYVDVPWWRFHKHLVTRDTTRLANSLKEDKQPKVVPLDYSLIDNPTKPLQLTWLGHSSVLVQMDGVNILCDPMFSQRCSEFSWIGPERYTRAPCHVSELPEKMGFLIISHNHHDHLDKGTLELVASRYPDIKVFAPLGNQPLLNAIGFKDIQIADWWDEFEVNKFTIACTPAQHNSFRGVMDRNATLWSSWVIRGPSQKTFFFAGDTAYSATGSEGECCPAFKQIGQVYGPIDLAALPIGGYGPEEFFDNVNSSPEQAVLIHEDIGARRSVPIHWGTFGLTSEPTNEPSERFRLKMEGDGKNSGEFAILRIGETTPCL